MNSKYCPVCLVRLADSPHHIKPLARGGLDEIRNIVRLCRRCHDIVEEIYELTGKEYSPYLAQLIRKLYDFSLLEHHQESTRLSRFLYMKEWYQKNREHKNTYVREWNHRNKERTRAHRNAYARERRKRICVKG